MLKSGNGRPKKCVENLLSIIRGEIPFDRVRGMDARIMDKASDTAKDEFEQDALWNIRTYEPRIEPADVNISINDKKGGDFTVDIDISNVEAEEV